MKSTQTNNNRPNAAIGRTVRNLCLRSCQRVLARIRRVKNAILAESRAVFQEREQMLKLALNEAEALAWQTPYPHLVFPDLATERVQAVVDWSRHQKSIWGTSPIRALPA